MTKKDYIAIAAALKNQQPNIPESSQYRYGYKDGLKMAAEAIADVFAQDNPRFNRETFLKAAGVL